MFIANAISGLVQFARYISAPMTLRYGTSVPISFLQYFLDRG
jgi:hypothetical protein